MRVCSRIGGPAYAGRVAPGLCLMAWPRPWRASLVTAGCEARGKAEGLPFHPGVTGKGQTGRVNCVNLR